MAEYSSLRRWLPPQIPPLLKRQRKRGLRSSPPLISLVTADPLRKVAGTQSRVELMEGGCLFFGRSSRLGLLVIFLLRTGIAGRLRTSWSGTTPIFPGLVPQLGAVTPGICSKAVQDHRTCLFQKGKKNPEENPKWKPPPALPQHYGKKQRERLPDSKTTGPESGRL